MEVALGKPTLETIGRHDHAAAVLQERPGGEVEVLSSSHGSWAKVVVAVKLQPWPDRSWLILWKDEAVEMPWPDHLEEPMLDGRKLFFEAREDELEDAWAAVKARVETTNRTYRDEYLAFQMDEPEVQDAEPDPLREAMERRVDALE